MSALLDHSSLTRRAWGVVILHTMLAVGAAQGAEPLSTPRQRAEAQVKLTTVRLTRDHDLAAATAGYHQATNIDASFTLPWFYMGAIAEEQQRWTEATDDYQRFIQMDNASDLYVEARTRLDAVRAAMAADATPEGKRNRKYTHALTVTQRALAADLLELALGEAKAAEGVDPTRWEAFVIEAGIQVKAGRIPEARAALTAALEKAPAAQKAMLQKALQECDNQTAAQRFATEGAEAAKRGDVAGAAACYGKAYTLVPTQERWGLSAALASGLAHDTSTAKPLLDKLSRSQDAAIATEARSELQRLRQVQAATAPAGGAAQKPEYEQLLARARKLLVAGMYDDASDSAVEALRLDPHRYEAHCVVADAMNRLGRFDVAAAHVREAMPLAPASVQPKLRQALDELQTNAAFDNEAKAGDAALSANDYSAAGDHYAAAWKIVPARGATGLRAAMMLVLAERTDDARPILEKLVASTDPRVCREAAEQLKMLESFRRQQEASMQAEALILKMREKAGVPIQPTDNGTDKQADDARAKGDLLAAASNWDQAEVAYRDAVRLRPNDAATRHLLGNSLAHQRKWKEAVEQYKAAVQGEPKDAVYHDELGVALFQCHQVPEAIAEFKAAIQIEPANNTYHVHLQQAGGPE